MLYFGRSGDGLASPGQDPKGSPKAFSDGQTASILENLLRCITAAARRLSRLKHTPHLNMALVAPSREYLGRVFYFQNKPSPGMRINSSNQGNAENNIQKLKSRCHCEERSDVATSRYNLRIFIALLWMLKACTGRLPRAYGPRNDMLFVSWLRYIL